MGFYGLVVRIGGVRPGDRGTSRERKMGGFRPFICVNISREWHSARPRRIVASYSPVPRFHVANYGGEHRYLIRLFRDRERAGVGGRVGAEGNYRTRKDQPARTNRKLRQTSGRLDETAERHETEGKRKWQGLSLRALPPFLTLPLRLPLPRSFSLPVLSRQVVPRAGVPPINYATGYAVGLRYRLRSTFAARALLANRLLLAAAVLRVKFERATNYILKEYIFEPPR